MQFSVKLFLLAVTLVAGCISAMVGANEQSMRLIASFVFLANCVAATVAVLCVWPTRAFAIGFLIGCLPYLYLVHSTRGNGSRYLITDVSIEVIDHKWKLSEPKRTPAGETVLMLDGGLAQITIGRTRRVTTWEAIERMGYTKYGYRSDLMPSKQHVKEIGHFAVALLVGCGNGCLGLILIRNRRFSRPSTVAGGGDSQAPV